MHTILICHNEEVDNNGDDSVIVPRPIASIPNFSGPVHSNKILDAFTQQNALLCKSRSYDRRRLSIIIVPEIPIPAMD